MCKESRQQSRALKHVSPWSYGSSADALAPVNKLMTSTKIIRRRKQDSQRSSERRLSGGISMKIPEPTEDQSPHCEGE